jgi:hypothetical protein
MSSGDLIGRYVGAALDGAINGTRLYILGDHNDLATLTELISNARRLRDCVAGLTLEEQAQLNTFLQKGKFGELMNAVDDLRQRSSTAGPAEKVMRAVVQAATVYVLDAYRKKPNGN